MGVSTYVVFRFLNNKEEKYMNYKEIKAINHIDEEFSSIMKKFGYSKVFPKSIEQIGDFDKFYERSKCKTLKVIGNNSEVNILHDDPTMSLFTSALTIEKVYYITKSFSWESPEYETLKAGVENLGKESIYSDAEIIFSAYQFLKSIGLDNFYIEIGHTHFIEKLLDLKAISKEDRDILYNLIHSKNVVQISNILDKYNLSKISEEFIKKLPKLFGDIDEILNYVEQMADKNEELQVIYDYLRKLINLLKVYGIKSKHLKIDLSLTNKYSYYDGVIFKTYSNDFGKEVIRGGRYTIDEQPFNVKGVGYGFDLKNLIGVINMKKLNLNKNNFTILFNQNSVEAMVEISTILRNKGYKVNQIEGDLSKDTIDNIDSEYVLKISEDKIKIVDNLKNTVEKEFLDKYIKGIKTETIVESIH